MDEAEVAAILKQRNELKCVKCRIESGTIFLTGSVRSFYHKQLAFHDLQRKFHETRINTFGLEVKKNP